VSFFVVAVGDERPRALICSPNETQLAEQKAR